MTAPLALRYARMWFWNASRAFSSALGRSVFLISDARRSQGPPEGALTHVKTRGALMRIGIPVLLHIFQQRRLFKRAAAWHRWAGFVRLSHRMTLAEPICIAYRLSDCQSFLLPD